MCATRPRSRSKPAAEMADPCVRTADRGRSAASRLACRHSVGVTADRRDWSSGAWMLGMATGGGTGGATDSVYPMKAGPTKTAEPGRRGSRAFGSRSARGGVATDATLACRYTGTAATTECPMPTMKAASGFECAMRWMPGCRNRDAEHCRRSAQNSSIRVCVGLSPLLPAAFYVGRRRCYHDSCRPKPHDWRKQAAVSFSGLLDGALREQDASLLVSHARRRRPRRRWFENGRRICRGGR